MKISILFTIPGKPIAQARARAVRRANYVTMYDPKLSRQYKTIVATYAKQAYPLQPIDSAVKVVIDLFLPIPTSFNKRRKQEAIEGKLRPTKKPDYDNLVKGVQDAMNGICYTDDCQIVDAVISKYYSENPRVEVMVEEL